MWDPRRCTERSARSSTGASSRRFVPRGSRNWRTTAVARTVEQLGLEARLRIEDDPLRDADAKAIDKKWLLDTLEDQKATVEEKKTTIANFVLTGRKLST